MKTRWLPGFVALSAVWGSSFALIKILVDAGMPPLWVAFWRSALGATALWTIATHARPAEIAKSAETEPKSLRPIAATWVPMRRGGPAVIAHAAVAGLLLNAAPAALISYGETGISSVQAGIWNATTPLFTLLVTLVALRDTERLTAPRFAGLVLGFLGVLVVLGAWQAPVAGRLAASAACLGGAACYGAGYVYSRRFLAGLALPVTSLATLQITAAAVELAPLAPLGGLPRWPGLGAAAALLFLGVVGTGLAYALNLYLVRVAGATVASTVTYVLPIWSTALGGWLLSEPIGWNTPAGGLLVIFAIAISRATPTRPLFTRTSG